jgi:hypothetical protein
METKTATTTLLGKYIPSNNYVSTFLEHIQKSALQFPVELITFSKNGPDHMPTFVESYSTPRGEVCGTGPSRQKAKNHAYYLMLKQLEAQHIEAFKRDNVVMNRIDSNIVRIKRIESPLVPIQHETIGTPLNQELGTAIKPQEENQPSVRCKYYNELQEATFYSQGYNCYRNYKNWDETHRQPDLQGGRSVLIITKPGLKPEPPKTFVFQGVPEPEPSAPPEQTFQVGTNQLKEFFKKIANNVGSFVKDEDYNANFIRKLAADNGSDFLYCEFIKLVLGRDPIAEARFAQEFKEGGFNPYGHGQWSIVQFTLTKPGFNFTDQTWTCFSTCLMPDPVHCVGTGPTQVDAFDAWMADCFGRVETWSPPAENTLLSELKKLTRPEANSPIYLLWDDNQSVHTLKTLIEHQFRVLNVKDKEGTRNMYGNGQGVFFMFVLFYLFFFFETKVLLTKQQYLVQNKKSFSGLTTEQKLARWKKYANKHTINKHAAPKRAKQRVTQQAQPVGNLVVAKAPKYSHGQNVRAMSPCARAYLVALKCPFFWLSHEKPKCIDIQFPENQLPCYPGPDGFNTRKSMTFSRGTVGIQTTTNHGFFLLAPFRGANNYSGANNRDAPMLFSLTNPAAPVPVNQMPIVDTGAGAWAGSGGFANHNGDYTIANLVINAAGQGIKLRLVGCGMRFKYTGPLLTESGLMHFVTEPDHITLSNYTVQEIGMFEGYFNRIIHKDNQHEWHEMTFTPVMPDDLEFHPDPRSNAMSTIFDNHYMGVMFTGLPAGDVIQYEVVFFWEWIGNQVRGKTLSPVDPVGAAIVKNGINTDTQAQNDKGATPLSSVITDGKSMVSGVSELVGTAKELAGFAKMMLL